jgi:preprotein translocase subunit SecY
MLNTILTSLSVPAIRKKIAFTALMLGLYRFGANLTAPGINASAAKAL